MSLERDGYIDEIRRHIDIDRKQKLGRAVMQGRRSEAVIDSNQLPIKQSLPMQDANGNRYFVLGYSLVGGPDVVRP